MNKFTDKEFWRMLTLYGLNTSTYKIALAECLNNFVSQNISNVSWENLSKSFFDIYKERMKNNMPQLNHETRFTKMEQIVNQFNSGIVDYNEAISFVKENAFRYVISSFHILDSKSIKDEFGIIFFDKSKNGIILSDSLFNVFNDNEKDSLKRELDARWSLLESAFEMKRKNAQLINDVKMFYLLQGDSKRTDVTYMKDMLNGYQEGRCFYCGEMLDQNHIHVDHVIPRAYIAHDKPWNLVLSHEFCNESKSDSLPSEYYIQKLVDRNERLISSNHPLSKKIVEDLGKTPAERKAETFSHYYRILNAVGSQNIWGGISNFNPESDPFYKSMIRNLIQ